MRVLKGERDRSIECVRVKEREREGNYVAPFSNVVDVVVVVEIET